MQDFLTLAKNRFSVRKFQNKPVEKSVLESVLEAGNLAPTGCNIQPQRVWAITSQEGLEKIRRCTPYHFDAPVVLLVCTDESASWKRPFDGKNIGEIDATIVCTHYMLEATEQGLGSTWVAFFDPAKVKAEFALPDNIVPVALLPMGYPAPEAAPTAMHNRKPVDQTVKFV